MSDLVFVNEQLTAPPPAWSPAHSLAAHPPVRDQRSTQQQPQRRFKGNTSPKGKGAGKNNDKTAELCRGYNSGSCKMGDKCRYRH
eukprot:5565632-Amphidinium_carterae.1